MRMLVLFPKQQCYAYKDLATQRSLDERFNKYLKILVDANVKLETLLEDQLAYDILSKNGISDVDSVTCITRNDLEWISKYPEIEELSQRVFAEHGNARPAVYDADKKYEVPLSVIKEGRSVYYKARVDAYHKKYKYAINKYVKQSLGVLQFLSAPNLNRCKPISDSCSEGDGRLCIEVNLNNGLTNIYYGGIRINEEYLPTLLGL